MPEEKLASRKVIELQTVGMADKTANINNRSNFLEEFTILSEGVLIFVVVFCKLGYSDRAAQPHQQRIPLPRLVH